MKVRALFLLFTCATLVSGSVHAAEENPDKVAIESGRQVALLQCSGCHAIGTTGKSPRGDAPVFRTILSRYRPDVLEQDFDFGIKVGHAEMPEFQISPAAIGDLIVYLKSIQERNGRP